MSAIKEGTAAAGLYDYLLPVIILKKIEPPGQHATAGTQQEFATH